MIRIVDVKWHFYAGGNDNPWRVQSIIIDLSRFYNVLILHAGMCGITKTESTVCLHNIHSLGWVSLHLSEPLILHTLYPSVNMCITKQYHSAYKTYCTQHISCFWLNYLVLRNEYFIVHPGFILMCKFQWCNFFSVVCITLSLDGKFTAFHVCLLYIISWISKT